MDERIFTDYLTRFYFKAILLILSVVRLVFIGPNFQSSIREFAEIDFLPVAADFSWCK